ncbi:PhzF family phenazine biosynthesis protein [Vulcaniibacterium tengchongense]|uniref:PhzF family phenazine biosynthesis protein n=1 Tax=Vulcaniibacterium tengchongense TaxID=1273429 RepID=A0A3N4V957_9GAMM|nr:PhzF family phenazine biosynthesis isomerase [Vulcaniibacterium tengchongense]RPE79502.1 PhzF family phenazine biosynthesis protein [Vulcaniibacterium tengchongense]
MPELLRYAAFTDRPEGGNPAGVVLDATGLDEAAMLAIAADLGYSETAFLRPHGDGRYDIRYFSPLAEVPFCGHATIASAVAIAERAGPGTLRLRTRGGEIRVETAIEAGRASATLTSLAPGVEPVPEALLAQALEALRWRRDELDPALPPRIAFAGARHLLLAARTRERLRRLDYAFDALKAAMLAHDLTTVDLVWRETPTRFHARNPFPVGGVVEDPATGAAAAAFGGYLRALGLVEPPATVTILQGEDMGRPSLLTVGIGAAGGIRVGGHAVPIAG